MPSLPLIFQLHPLPYTGKSFCPKGWTESISAYMREADRLSRCILRNRLYMSGNYPWEVAINIEMELYPSAITSLWTTACRSLRRAGIVALWVREPSRTNHCNYHLIVKSQQSEVELEQLIDNAMPSRSDLPYHKHIAPVAYLLGFARYMTKAKVSGEVNGKVTDDKYENKRLLFQPRLGLRKIGTIGRFWEKPKAQLWQEIRDIEQQISDGLAHEDVKAAAKHVYEMLGEVVPLRRIERSFGYDPNHAAVRHWIQSLMPEANSGY